MLKLISNAAEEELVFVGAREPKERGAEGLVNAIKEACKGCGKDSPEESSNDSEEEGSDKRDLPDESSEFVLYETSLIVTDGTNINSRARSGLWTLLEKLRSEKCPSDELVPLLKIWCAVHCSQLAWKNVTENVDELLIQELKSLSTYFHTSGVRTRERQAIGNEYKLTVRRYPEYFQI